MRRTTLILVAYVLVVGFAEFELTHVLPVPYDKSLAAPVLPGLVPIATLAVMITFWGRSPGWVFAVAGLLLSMLTAASLMRPTIDWAGPLVAVPASVMLLIAMLRSGGWQVFGRHRRLAAAVVVGCAGLLVAAAVIAAAIYLATYDQPRGCVYSCFGRLVAVDLVIGVFGAVIALLTLGAAFANSSATGTGALIMFTAQIAAQIGTSQWSAYYFRYAVLVAAWYAALFAVVSPWTRPARALAAS